MQTNHIATGQSDQGLKHSTLSVVSGLLLAAAVGSAALLFTPISASTPSQPRAFATHAGTADDSMHLHPGFAVTGETDLSTLGGEPGTQRSGASGLTHSTAAAPHVEDAMNPAPMAVAAYE